MAIPAFQEIMLPLLKLASDGREHTPREVVEALAAEFHLTEEDRRQMLPSGRQAPVANRVAWAKAHMKMAGLIDSPSRGLFRITDRGLAVISHNPQKVNLKFLRRFPAYNDARTRKKKHKNDAVELEETTEQTPEESMEAAYKSINNDLAIEILDNIKGCTPGFFERLVVELIVKMGYGGSRQDAGRAVGKSSDGGIDGSIKEDKLAYSSQPHLSPAAPRNMSLESTAKSS